ncbi:hypothetical protein, partial [Schauerella aestuarii]|uniref:hypothetical protein n=1 Tax=Schauerella aestuarii TaxID=2511204 RepID=UPI001F3B73B4
MALHDNALQPAHIRPERLPLSSCFPMVIADWRLGWASSCHCVLIALQVAAAPRLGCRLPIAAAFVWRNASLALCRCIDVAQWQNPAGLLQRGFGNKSLTMTYFHRRPSTIIGAK